MSAKKEYCCPLCQSKVSKDARYHVLEQIYLASKDPNHKIEFYEGDKNDD